MEMGTYFQEEAFGTSPYPWQHQIITQLCCMVIPNSGIPPAPVLLVEPTDDGKSVIRNILSITNGAFLLTITPLILLEANVETKMTLKTKYTVGTVVLVHLDTISLLKDQNDLVMELKHLLLDGHTNVLLFLSPHVILNKKLPWSDFIDWLMVNKRLSMVCVDKVHLFVHFGLTFRDNFKGLTPVLFAKLKVVGSGTMAVFPLLFMTGIGLKTIVFLLQKLLGIHFDNKHNIFWPLDEDMQHCWVFFEVKMNFGQLLKDSTANKFMLYTNT